MRGGALIAVILLAGCAGNEPPPVAVPEPEITNPTQPAWQPTAGAGRIRDVEGLEDLAKSFPDSGSVRLRLLNAQVQSDDTDGALATLEWLYDRGYVFSELGKEQLSKLLPLIDPGRIAERLRADAEVVGTSQVIETIPEDALLIESVEYSPETKRLFAAAVVSAAVFRQVSDGVWTRVNIPQAEAVTGITRDPSNGLFWLSLGAVEAKNPARDAFHGLVKFDPEESAVVERYLTPRGVFLSDLTVAADGSVFASDPTGGGVYHLPAGSQTIVPLITPGTFRSPQGLALSSGGTALYASDYRYGLARIDLATRVITRVMTTMPIILDGIDGLWRRDDELIAVQNGTSPMRITAFKLSADGRSITGARILEQANAEWTEPLSGNIAGDTLLYIGNGQWDRFVGNQSAQDKPPLPTQIRRVPLD